jgi:GNAT superfamily N-acetyltransferase
MTSLQFIAANPATHREALLELNVEYVTWVLSEFGKIAGKSTQQMIGKDVPEYIAGVIDKVCGDPPPRGIFYLVESEGELAGMGGLRWIRDGVAEVKRIYVRPEQRGKRVGEAILQRILNDAKAYGYKSIWLDSAPFMQSAQRIYESFGFTDRPPYDEVEAPKEFHSMIRFMEKTL